MSEDAPEDWWPEDHAEADPESDYDPYRDDPWAEALKELKSGE